MKSFTNDVTRVGVLCVLPARGKKKDYIIGWTFKPHYYTTKQGVRFLVTLWELSEQYDYFTRV